MAKIIQLNGWYSTDKKEQKIIFNADHITTMTTSTENNATVTCINIESYNPDRFAPSIYTKLSIDAVIKLINEWEIINKLNQYKYEKNNSTLLADIIVSC